MDAFGTLRLLFEIVRQRTASMSALDIPACGHGNGPEKLTLGKALGQMNLEAKRTKYSNSIVDGNRTAIAGLD